MRLLADLMTGDVLAVYALGSLCVLFFLITGIVLVVTKNTNLINKKTVYRDVNKFTTLYGIIYISFSVMMAVSMTLGMVIVDLLLVFLLITVGLAAVMLTIQFVLHKKYKLRSIK